MTHLDPPEPVEVTWGRGGIIVVWTVDREWWCEPLARRAERYG